MNKTSRAIVNISALEALATAEKITGTVVDAKTPFGQITIQTESGVIVCTVDQFADAYRGMVRVWPTVALIRQQQTASRREKLTRDREAARLSKLQSRNLSRRKT